MTHSTVLNRQQALQKYPFLAKVISGEMIMPSYRLIKLFGKKCEEAGKPLKDSGLNTRIPETVNVLLTEEEGVLPLAYRPTELFGYDLEGVYFFGEKGEGLSGITWDYCFKKIRSISSYFDFFGSSDRILGDKNASTIFPPPAFATLVKLSRTHIRIALYSKIDEGTG